MYLSRLDVQGFKTFAQKTTLLFPAPSSNHRPMTVIVGPNGSGKSNLADAIRWCLGEQSIKSLRGKKAEDIIFSGSQGRGRSGFAEVALTFDNTDGGFPLEYSEVTMTRRLYRDGESEYLLNGEATRLQDIHLLLAQAGVGQRSYAVIGQGMIDQIIVATPEERKSFFDDATGIREFQLKRHQAVLKLTRSSEHLAEVEMILQELEPRLGMLRRQVRKLEERDQIERKYHEAARSYYATMWWNTEDERLGVQKQLEGLRQEIAIARNNVVEIDKRLADCEAQQKAVGAADAAALHEAHQTYKHTFEKLHAARRKQQEAEREIELARVRAQSSWAPLPLTEIISELERLVGHHDELVTRLASVKDLAELDEVVAHSKTLHEKAKSLHRRLVRPNLDDWQPSDEQRAAVEQAKQMILQREEEVKQAEAAVTAKTSAPQTASTEVFALQREARDKQRLFMEAEAKANADEIALARVETRLQGLVQEIKEAFPETFVQEIRTQAPTERVHDLTKAHEDMRRLRHQLELIGGIDPEVVKEYGEVSERFTFLTTQVEDLRKALTSTRVIVAELDKEIETTSDEAFTKINDEFQKYFKVLFGGGSCALLRIKSESPDADASVGDRHADPQSADEAAEKTVANADIPTEKWSGVEIQATPPGKTQKSLSLLSGGERALTSIALLCAVMATNPSPFVVLDEVDAALDETNTVRFANILNELRHRTQFLVITHNRATMEKADALYGVTMGDEGISQLLSVKLEDFANGHSARR